jgi:hypothetical protein
MRGIIFSLPFLITACASDPGVQVKYVDRPVVETRNCLRQEDIPKPPDKLRNTTTPHTIDSALSIALAKIAEWEKYGSAADAAMQSCVTPNKK